MPGLKIERLVRKLGETVGDAKAREAYQSAAKALGMTQVLELDQTQTLSILEEIGKQEDVTGLAAKLLHVRVMISFNKLVSDGL